MPEKLVVRLTVPVKTETGYGLTFSRWLPDGEADGLVMEADGMTTRLWISRDCLGDLSDRSDDHIAMSLDNSVEVVHVSVVLDGVPDELAGFIYGEREAPRGVHHGIGPDHPRYASLRDQYRDTGVQVLRQALSLYNRLIAYARNLKGQFWLTDYPFDQDNVFPMSNAFSAVFRSGDQDWERWCPPGGLHITITLPSDETAIARADWPALKEFVVGQARPDLVFELLANADLLVERKHGRSALIEAVSALEVAISRFAKSPRLGDLLAGEALTPLCDDSLQSHVEHLGLGVSVRYLLPLLFAADVLPRAVLASCHQAIELRNSVVHGGKRSVDPARVRPATSAIRSACEVLRRHTNRPGEGR
jgi:hypothetical protein